MRIQDMSKNWTRVFEIGRVPEEFQVLVLLEILRENEDTTDGVCQWNLLNQHSILILYRNCIPKIFNMYREITEPELFT